MIRRLTLTNIKCHKSFDMEIRGDGHISVAGRNGCGKSTLRDALAFLFTGRDANGNRKPLYLNPTSDEPMEVTLVMENGPVSRATRKMTAKGTSSLKVERAGVEFTLKTQQEIDKLFGDQERLMSILIPGYFMKLPPKEKSRIFQTMFGHLDLIPILGKYEESTHLSHLNPNKKVQSLLSDVDSVRIGLEKSIASLEGAISARQGTLDDQPAPTFDPEVFRSLSEELRLLEPIRNRYLEVKRLRAQREWAQTELRDLEHSIDTPTGELDASLKESQALLEGARNANAELAEEIRRLTDEKASLRREDVPELPQVFSIDEDKIGGGRCTTCGQVVGDKHRERIAAAREEKLEAAKKARKAVLRRNNEVDRQDAELRDKIRKARGEWEASCDAMRRHNADVEEYRNMIFKRDARIEAAKERYEAKKKEAEAEVPELPDFSEQRYEELKKSLYQLEADRKYYQQQADGRIQLRTLNSNDKKAIERNLKAVEDCKNLAADLKKAQADFIKTCAEKLNSIPGFKVDFLDGDVQVHMLQGDRLIPYDLLSAGERMYFDTRLSLLIASIKEFPIAVVDDANLVSAQRLEDLRAEASRVGVQLVQIMVTDGGMRVSSTTPSGEELFQCVECERVPSGVTADNLLSHEEPTPSVENTSVDGDFFP